VKKSIARREALKNIACAGAGALLATSKTFGLSAEAIRIADRAIEIGVAQVSSHTMRLSLVPIENGQPKSIPNGGSIIPQAWGSPHARFRALARTERISLGKMTVEIKGEPLTITFAQKNGSSFQQLRIDEQTGTVFFDLGGGPLLGLGEGGPQFDRRGNKDEMRSGQGGYRLRTHGGRVPIPWLVGTSGWAMFIHQPFGKFDLTGREGRFDPTNPATSLPMDIFIVAAREPQVIMGEYARLTGYPEVPPLWSLGYLQSHRTLAGPEEIMWVARTFREKKLPCEALIYLGTDFSPSGWNTHNGEFTWNTKNFPDPNKMIDELHAQHFKVVLHTVLEGRRLTGSVSDPCTAAPLPSGRTPDGRWPDDRQVSCYWPIHKQLYDVGIDGWWPDQGDGLDGPSRLARHRMYWEGSQQLRPNERPFALHRNGQAGMQRYAAFLWSGDVYSTWETLKTHVPVAVNTGLTGIPYWGTDIGGFVPTKDYTGELYVRWFQFGAFCPLFRAHGRTWHLRLPWGWNTGELGPNEIANYTGGAANPDETELHNAAVEPICRKYLELRYRLMPYLYSSVRECCRTGMPIMRALWLHYPDDAVATARGDEYLWGRDILVAPVTEKSATSRTLYLPRGVWYDFWTEEKIEGGREIARAVDLTTMPLYARAGAIIPFGPVKQYTREKVDDPLTLQIYPGANGNFLLYEDDGSTFNYHRGEWMGIQMAWNDHSRQLTLRLAEGSRMLPQLRRKIEVRIVTEKTMRAIVFEGRPVQLKFQ
jgi:alpha-glucosidase (family GH31 glycosyl hydrolase)